MYTKRKKYNSSLIDNKTEYIVNDLIIHNEDAVFAISKNFIEKKENKQINLEPIESSDMPIIYSSLPIEDLYIPSQYELLKDNVINLKTIDNYTNCYCAKLIQNDLRIMDYCHNGGIIEDYFLDMDIQDKCLNIKK